MKLKTILLSLLLVFIAACRSQAGSQESPGSNYLEAVSDSNNIYYIIKNFSEEKWSFSVLHTLSSEPQLPLMLNNYPDSPRFFICHDGKAVAFFNDGTCLGYGSNSQKTTYQSLPKNQLPLNAVSVKNNIYLLTIDNGRYNIFHLDNNQWQLFSALPDDTSEKFLTPRIFVFDNQLYLAGITSGGTLICDAVNNNQLDGLDISLDENRKLKSIDAIISVNRTNVFILQVDSHQPSFIAAKFINNSFTSKVDISTSSLPEISSRKFSFISCQSDLMLAVYDQKQIHMQKYDLNGTLIDQPMVSYPINTEDSINNIYLQILGYLSTVIVAATIIIYFKKAIAGGPIPNTAQGSPCPITLRLPAFIIDMICLSFFMEIVFYLLDAIHIINKQQFARAIEQMPIQLKTTGTISIDINQLIIIMISIYVVMIIYFTLFEWLLSLTPGKALFGLKVADYNTLATIKEKALGRILLRNIFRVFELLSLATLVTLPLIIIIMTLSPRKQRPGDMVANTTVILTRQHKKNTGKKIDHQA